MALSAEEKKIRDREKTYRWRKKNPDKVKEIQRRSYERNHHKHKPKILQWRKEHPENCKQYYLRRNIVRMGLTPEEFDNKLSEQNGVCAICGGVNPNGRRLFIDHNHDTGVIRGLLCNHCNNGIGNFQENIEFLNSAISYLKEWENAE